MSDLDSDAQRIVVNLFKTNATVLFTRDLKRQEAAKAGFVDRAPTQSFSTDIQRQGMQIIQQMLSQTEKLQPDRTVAVATEAFRRASNGLQYAEVLKNDCKVAVTVLPAQEEAQLGFHAAAAISGFSKADLISWDCGAGSFQLSTLSHGSHMDSHGSGTVEGLARPLRARGFPPVQVVDELLRTLRNELLKPIPTSLQEAIHNPAYQVVAIGSQHSIFNQQRVISGKNTFCQRDVEKSLLDVVNMDPSRIVEWELERSRQLVGGDDDDRNEQRCIDNAIFLVPKLILLLAAMQHAHMQHATFYKTNGICDALLTQPRFWGR